MFYTNREVVMFYLFYLTILFYEDGHGGQFLLMLLENAVRKRLRIHLRCFFPTRTQLNMTKRAKVGVSCSIFWSIQCFCIFYINGHYIKVLQFFLSVCLSLSFSLFVFCSSPLFISLFIFHPFSRSVTAVTGRLTISIQW